LTGDAPFVVERLRTSKASQKKINIPRYALSTLVKLQLALLTPLTLMIGTDYWRGFM
jgi:hypothetical protein